MLRHRVVPHFGFVYVEIPVYHQQCTTCSHIWSVEWRGIPQYGKVTTLFREAVLSLCQDRSLSSAAQLLKVPYTTLERWYYQWVEEATGSMNRDRPSPAVICLDDFATHKGHRYAISLVDHEKGEVCQIGEGRSRKAIQRTLRKWPYDPPNVVVTDLAPGMAKTVQEVWPDTLIAADPFHVIQLFTKEVDRSRKQATKKEKSQSKRRNITRILTTKPIHLTFKELFQLEERLSEDGKLTELYQALQGLRRLYGQREPAILQRAFDQWIDRYLFSDNRNVHRIAKTVLQWKKPIIQAILFQVSNGKIEGINNKIKLIMRRAFGFRNMRHLELRVQLETTFKSKDLINHRLW